jgi:serine protease Do
MKPGAKADLQVWRDKSTKTISATIGKLGDTKVASNDTPQSQVQGRLGVAVRPLTPDEMNNSSLTHGLVVGQVSGAAASAGIQPGDVILAVNGRPVSNAQQLKDMVSKAGSSIALLIQRDNAQIFVPVDLG